MNVWFFCLKYQYQYRMYIYVIKCCNFYKIGFSKNPKNRRATIQTHNPLDVKICATLKTGNHLILEKELHNTFSEKRTRGEWFELSNDDLLYLKIEKGFSFKIPISKINQDEQIDSSQIKAQTKKYRLRNEFEIQIVSLFESVFKCKITDSHEIRKCVSKYDFDIIHEAIDKLLSQDLSAEKAYHLLFKVCGNIKESNDNPSGYFTKIVKAIFYKRYNCKLTHDELEYLESNFQCSDDMDSITKTINTKKFYLEEDEFWDLILLKYMK